MIKVLFLCTENSCRSQMAEAFLRKYGGDHFEVYSEGLGPRGINPFTMEVMKENGLDISNQSSKGVNINLDKILFQYLITVCDNAEKNCPSTWPGVDQRMHWSFEDPAAFEGTADEKRAKFCQIRDQIEECIKL